MGWVMSWGAFIGVLKAWLGTDVKHLQTLQQTFCVMLNNVKYTVVNVVLAIMICFHIVSS